MAAGFVVGGNGTKQILLRAVGPGLSPFGVSGLLADPVLTVFDSTGASIASNDNWDAPNTAVFATVGAFALLPGSKDAALLRTFAPGAYTAVVSGNGATGAALLEVYDAGGSGQLINLSTRLQTAAGTPTISGFVVSAGTGSRKFLIRGVGPGLAQFGLSGTLPDPSLVLRDQSAVTLSTATANAASSSLALVATEAGAFTATSKDAALIATLPAGNYTVQVVSASGTGSGTVILELYDVTGFADVPAGDGSPAFYLAKLAPAANAPASTASGYATILFDPATGTGKVAVHFSNLSSAEVVAHLELGTPGSGGTVVLGLVPGQVDNQTWTIGGSGQYSASQVVAALQSGQIFVEVDSSSYPSGELFGAFVPAQASQTFTAPAASPPLPSGLIASPDPKAAARLLAQATFGPKSGDGAAVMTRGISGWIDDQIALPASLHLAATRADAVAFPPPTAGVPGDEAYMAVTPAARQAGWWKLALTAPDQLRQRVAFALSEILVVSEQDTVLRAQSEALANYYDLLVKDAFGNFRQLLEDVSRSPVMATFLSFLRNQPGNAVTGTSPDENYAREVQQLFTVGLVRLQPDGTVLLDAGAHAIPTFSQATISQTAKVFTGWSFANVANFLADPADTKPSGAANDSAWLNPIAPYDNYHDPSAKALIDGTLPAGQSAAQDFKGMLDQLFNDTNTGPFFCRQLIQRLVTSNPSPGYIYRVAQVFANDGTGTRGNLAAVIKAILLDYEARSPAAAANVGFGKIKEPLIRMTGLFRALNASAANGRYLDSFYNDPRGGYAPSSLLALPEYFLGEGALQAPTVFNFFSPDYSVPGPLAAAGLVAPEMALATDAYSLNLMNEVSYYLLRDVSALRGPGGGAPSPFLALDYSAFLPLANDPAGLLDALDLTFCGGNLSATTRASVTTALQSLSASASATERTLTAVWLIVCSPDGARQK
jgi:uncharacterized protein (DUF1800 family)